MTQPASDSAPSPWWPCPECGGIHLQPDACTWERGQWASDTEWAAFDPPSGRPTGVSTAVTCTGCGHRFDLARLYGWPIVGAREG